MTTATKTSFLRKKIQKLRLDPNLGKYASNPTMLG
jgi:hypothetical protein